MNILIISTQNPFRTSGVVAYNLYNGLKDENNNTKLLIKSYIKSDSDDIISVETFFDDYIRKWKYRFEYLLKRLGIELNVKKVNPDYHIQDFDQTIQYYRTKKILKKIKFKPDVIIYLFQQNFLNAKNLYELNKMTRAKVFWYLMDTAPLTGACHYSWECKGYTTGCGKCPALYSINENDQSSINFKFKNKYLSQTEIDIIVATEWQKNQALASRLYKNKSVHKILLSIDSDVYDFVPKIKAKAKLGISTEKKTIFFGATSIHHTRKGMKYLIEALQILKEDYNQFEDQILLLIAGNFDVQQTAFPYEFKRLGLLDNNEQLASIYQAADIFVCPSIEDSGPMMINQSIMTGTPVVAFEMGVALDLVITGETGYRARLRDSYDLAKGMNAILELDNEAFEKMSSNCRELGLKLCHPDVTKKQFNRLFYNGRFEN